jgi:plasmid stabilization system protein ParE
MPRARREIHAAGLWWSQNRISAPGAIATDVEAALIALAAFPGIGTKVDNASDPSTRAWHLRRTGYNVFYRVRGNVLQVVAFWHSSREHGPSV